MHTLTKTQRDRSTMGLLWRRHAKTEWVSFRRSAHLSTQYCRHTTNMRVLACLFLLFLDWRACDVIGENWGKYRNMNREDKGGLNFRTSVQTVNTSVGRGSLAMPVGNYSIYAHKMPRLWFMALPLGHGFLSPPLVAIQTSQHFTITAIVVERPR